MLTVYHSIKFYDIILYFPYDIFIQLLVLRTVSRAFLIILSVRT